MRIRAGGSVAFLMAVMALGPAAAAQHDSPDYIPETDRQVLESLEHWRDIKFGLLMHWGPYSQWGVVESWSICAEDEGWCRRNIDNYTEYKKRYEALKNTFNPVKFDPDRWAEAARRAGMRYVVFTTKHHDGFCMFDTHTTGYKVTDAECKFSTNPRANITREIFDAFREQGFMVGAYFSKPDWHSKDYWWPNFATPDRNVNYDITRYPERWERFVRYTHNQILELMNDYGRVDILWLDGGWVAKRTREQILRAITSPNYKFTHIQSQDIRMDELVAKARAKQPGLIVVDRAVPGPNQDYLTPENRVPEARLPYPWESCIIMGGGWSYVPGAHYKPARELVQMLVEIVCKGGNLLLNIGPAPDGTWPPDAYDRLEKIGRWMDVNSEAIYGTREVAPFKEGKVCLTRKKDDTLYLIYLGDENETGPPPKVSLSTLCPPPGTRIAMLGCGETFDDRALQWEPAGEGFVVQIPEALQAHPPCDYAWTLRVEYVRR